jgi:hypothetical protein
MIHIIALINLPEIGFNTILEWQLNYFPGVIIAFIANITLIPSQNPPLHFNFTSNYEFAMYATGAA